MNAVEQYNILVEIHTILKEDQKKQLAKDSISCSSQALKEVQPLWKKVFGETSHPAIATIQYVVTSKGVSWADHMTLIDRILLTAIYALQKKLQNAGMPKAAFH